MPVFGRYFGSIDQYLEKKNKTLFFAPAIPLPGTCARVIHVYVHNKASVRMFAAVLFVIGILKTK